MHLLEWNPQVTVQYHVPVLCAKATLRCPVCQEVVEIETDGHISDNRSHMKTPLAMQIGWITDRLIAPRDCENCGTTSTLPMADRQRLLRDASKRITVKWIESEASKITAAAA